MFIDPCLEICKFNRTGNNIVPKGCKDICIFAKIVKENEELKEFLKGFEDDGK